MSDILSRLVTLDECLCMVWTRNEANPNDEMTRIYQRGDAVYRHVMRWAGACDYAGIEPHPRSVQHMHALLTHALNQPA